MKPKTKDPVLFTKIRDFLTSYLPVIKRKSPHTVAAYRDALNLYTGYICAAKNKKLHAVTQADFNRDDIVAFLRWLRSERGNTAATANQRLSHVKGFCRYAVKSDILSALEYEDIRDISEEKDTRVQDFIWMSIGDVRLMMEQPDIKKKTGIRDRFFMALLYESGCRDDEMLHLKIKDFVINKDGEADLHVFGKGSKHRCTPISSDIMPYYREYCSLYHPEHGKNQDELLFYTVRNGIMVQMSQDNVQRFLKTYEKTAREKNPELPHQHPHLWRRTRAMHLYLAGVPLPLVSEWLGHSDEVTTRVYARATDEMKRQAQRKLNQSEGAVFKDDVAFKYADDEETLKKLSGLK